MEIPWKNLQPETLQSLIEEYVSRDGTDYGTTEVPNETKVKQVLGFLEKGRLVLVFDPESESCNFQEALN